MAKPGKNAVAGYVLVLLVLAVLTYLEFAIVEYPQEWLGRGGTLASLIVMSVGKFILVILYFMHLKEDDVVYSGWFASGMFLALGSFIGFIAMFVYPTAMQTFPEDPVNIMSEARAAEVATRIPGDGVNRTAAEIARSPAPSTQSATPTAPTAKPSEDFELVMPDTEDVEDVATDVADEVEDIVDDAQEAVEDTAEETVRTAEDVIDDAVEAIEDTAETVTEAVSGAIDSAIDTAEDVVESVEEAITGGADDAEEAVEEVADVTWDEDLGASVYQTNCMSCHQVAGDGIPGAFPPLHGHAADVYAVDGGASYLVNVLLFGLDGAIEVDGMTYSGVPMPAWKQFSDEEVAAVTNHIVAGWAEGTPSGFVPVTAADVEAERGNDYTNKQVYELRNTLDL